MERIRILTAVIGALLLAHATLAACVFVITAIWMVRFEAIAPGSIHWFTVMTASFLVALTVVAILLGRSLRRGNRGDRFGLAYGALSALCIIPVAGFSSTVMHDVALEAFESHGRFGCSDGVDYIVDDGFLLLVLGVIPPALVVLGLAARWFLNRRGPLST